jgi:hypothetical protein
MLDRQPLEEETRGKLACLLDPTGCTLCNDTIGRCPEWSSNDVGNVIQAQVKTSACLSVIFLGYAVDAFRFGIIMQKRISMYQIAFV